MAEEFIPGQHVWVYLKTTNHDAVNPLTNPEGLVDDATAGIQAEDPVGVVTTLSPVEHVSLGLYRAKLRLSVPRGSYTARSTASVAADTVGEVTIQVGRSPFVP